MWGAKRSSKRLCECDCVLCEALKYTGERMLTKRHKINRRKKAGECVGFSRWEGREREGVEEGKC